MTAVVPSKRGANSTVVYRVSPIQLPQPAPILETPELSQVVREMARSELKVLLVDEYGDGILEDAFIQEMMRDSPVSLQVLVTRRAELKRQIVDFEQALEIALEERQRRQAT